MQSANNAVEKKLDLGIPLLPFFCRKFGRKAKIPITKDLLGEKTMKCKVAQEQIRKLKE